MTIPKEQKDKLREFKRVLEKQAKPEQTDQQKVAKLNQVLESKQPKPTP